MQHRTQVLLCIVLFWFFANVQSLIAQQNQDPSDAIIIKSALVKSDEAIEIPVEQAGILTALEVQAGSRVEVGNLIACVDDRAIQQRLEKVRLDHDLAKKLATNQVDREYALKSYEVALSDLRRSNEANVRVANSVPVSRVEKQQLESDRARLMLQKAGHDLEVAAFKTRLTSAEIAAAQLELMKTEVRSKTDGLVVSIDKRVGEWVQPSDVVCRVVRTDRLRVEGFVSAENASKILVGSSATVQFSYPWMKQKSVEGNVVFVSPDANPVNLNVQVWVEIPNHELMIPTGVRGDIVIPSSRNSNRN